MSENEATEVLNQLWVEKYRPKTLEDIVLTDEQRMFFKKCIDSDEIPHTLLFGPPGSGKTTLARVLVYNLINNDGDVLYLNGSEDTGVDIVRDTISSFLKTPPFSSKLKIVFIDEFDYMTKNAQAMLRNIMETYSSNGRFIMTANYENKIIDPLMSRLTSFELKTIPKDYLVSYITKILKTENVKYDDSTVDLMVTSLIPDVRKIINIIQKNVENGLLRPLKAEELVTVENKICGMIVEMCDSLGTDKQQIVCNRVIPTIISILNSKDEPEYNKLYDRLFDFDGLPAWAKIKVNKYANDRSNVFSENHHFLALCYDILHTGMSYIKTFGSRK